MTDKLLKLINDKYGLSALDVGEFSTLKASGMTFAISAFRAEGLGHVSVMRAKGFFGLMKMDTLMVVPDKKDLPLYSYDRIFAMGNDTLIVELYDTLTQALDTAPLDAANEKYAHLPERDPGEHWYDSIKLPQSISKKGKKQHTRELDALALLHFEAYICANAKDVSDKTQKDEKTSLYVNGLLERGGPSTDVFKKKLGEDKTTKLFREVLFGTSRQ